MVVIFYETKKLNLFLQHFDLLFCFFNAFLYELVIAKCPFGPVDEIPETGQGDVQIPAENNGFHNVELGEGIVAVAVFRILLKKTLPREQRIQDGFFHSLFHIVKVLRVRSFMQPLLMFSLLAAPYMGYLAVSSFIYEDGFHLTPQEYALAYGVNFLAAAAGPFLFLALRQIWSEGKYILYIFALCVISMTGLLFFSNGPLSFFLSFLPFTVMEASMRPYAMEMLLSRVEKDVGSAAAMINFMPSLAGSVGMALVVLPFAGYVMNLGLMMAATTFVSILLCLTDKDMEEAEDISMEKH